MKVEQSLILVKETVVRRQVMVFRHQLQHLEKASMCSNCFSVPPKIWMHFTKKRLNCFSNHEIQTGIILDKWYRQFYHLTKREKMMKTLLSNLFDVDKLEMLNLLMTHSLP